MHLFLKLFLFVDFRVIFMKPHDYRIVHDHAVVDSFNKLYYSSFTINNIKLNRTIRTFIAKFVLEREIPFLTLIVQPYVFLSNEYKTWNAARAVLDYCNMLDKNLFGTWKQLQKFSNFTKCPLKKNNYYLSNLLPDDNDMPANLPTGKYKVEIKFITTGKVDVFQFSWYGSVESTKPLRRKVYN